MANVPETIHYFTSDYDGTIAKTDEAPIGGVGVDEASAMAIEAQTELGSAAAEEFISAGGSRSRAPLEIIEGLRPDLTPDRLKRLTRAFIGDKLDILVAQQGMLTKDNVQWPAFTDGFVELWRSISEERRRRIGTAVISSGHLDFIKGHFDMYQLELPDSIVSYESIGSFGLRLPDEKKLKPNPFPMELGTRSLDAIYGDATVKKVIYAGDSQEKDGGLAENTNVDFVLINPTNAKPGWLQVGRWLDLDAYREAA